MFKGDSGSIFRCRGNGRSSDQRLWFAALALALVASHAAAQCPPFDTGVTLFPAEFSTRIASGDFNGDGVLDVAIAGAQGAAGEEAGLAILLGDGLGGFGPPSYILLGAFGSEIEFVQAADLNSDGHLDLIATDYQGGVIYVLLGDGQGNFSSPVGYFTGAPNPLGAAVADVNHDGKMDLIVANLVANGSGGIGVLLGNGDGTFGAVTVYRPTVSAGAVAAADLNGDGWPDIVAIAGDEAVVFLNDGAGHFNSSYAVTFAAPYLANDIQIVDMNGDGNLDVVLVGNSNSPVTGNAGEVEILLGDGHGHFPTTRSSAQPALFVPYSVSTADVNGDGHLDLVVPDVMGQVVVLYGDGAGNFSVGPTLMTTSPSTNAVISDLIGDGLKDILIGGGYNGPPVIATFEQREDGSFPGPKVTSVGVTNAIYAFGALADFDGDGKLDLALSGYTPTESSIAVARGDGGGGFLPPTLIPSFFGPGQIRTGDFTGDGFLDIAFLVADTLSVFPGDGAGNFGAAIQTTGFSGLLMAVADFDGDGKLDVAISDPGGGIGNTVYVALGNGDGTFGAFTPYQVGTQPLNVEASDVNGDGKIDLVVANSESRDFSVLIGNGDGTFQSEIRFGLPGTCGGPLSMAVGDVNGDGHPDIAFGCESTYPQVTSVVVMLNDGTGFFNSGPALPLLANRSVPYSVAIADVNGDGIADVLASDQNTGLLWVFLGAGGGSFGSGSYYMVGGQPDGVLTGDLNGDGATDAVVTNNVFATVSVLLGNDCIPPTVTAVAPNTGPTGGGTPVTLTGSGFKAGALVLFGGVAATGVAVTDSGHISATTPFHGQGLVDVKVTNSDGLTGTLHNGFTYQCPDSGCGANLTSSSPSSGPASGPVELTLGGTNFEPGATVSVGGLAATAVHAVSPTEVTASTPALPAGTLNDVSITNPGTSTASVLAKAFFADFLDVVQSDPFHSYVETIFRDGITAGCSGGNYCRDNPVTRAQMAVFLLKGEHGSTYVPPGCMGIFPDVECTPVPAFAVNWIEELYNEAITGGCGGGNYCPGSSVTRAQMAAFLLKAEHGSSYTPPACTGVFGDVTCPSLFADWIEQLYTEGVTGGCQSSPLLYCPGNAVTRGQMAVFLVKSFGLQ